MKQATAAIRRNIRNVFKHCLKNFLRESCRETGLIMFRPFVIEREIASSLRNKQISMHNIPLSFFYIKKETKSPS